MKITEHIELLPTEEFVLNLMEKYDESNRIRDAMSYYKTPLVHRSARNIQFWRRNIYIYRVRKQYNYIYSKIAELVGLKSLDRARVIFMRMQRRVDYYGWVL